MLPRKDIGIFSKKKKKEHEEKPTNKEEVDGKESLMKDSRIKTTAKDRKEKYKEKIEREKLQENLKIELGELNREIGSEFSPIEHMNFDEYSPADPNNVSEKLKSEGKEEIIQMKKLRESNFKKLIEEDIEADFCYCRKPLEGFMVRCVLCLEWFHSTCIVVPRSVYGKPIGKGFTTFAATREVRYLCTSCCRSRRPRLDIILTLLMALQKLPVRVPEGEALQYLTERAMNWQDRAKQVLNHPEIQNIIRIIKLELENAANQKQSSPGGVSMTHILLIQKLLCVKVLHDNKDLKSEGPSSIIKTEPFDIDVKEDSQNLMKDALMCKENININTLEKTLEAPLECSEKLSHSPEPSKELLEETALLKDNPHVSQLKSENSSRAQSPIDVITPVETNLTLKLQDTKECSEENIEIPLPQLYMKPLPDELLLEMETLMYEGDLLEVGLDEVSTLWALLQIQKPLKKEDCKIMVYDLVLYLKCLFNIDYPFVFDFDSAIAGKFSIPAGFFCTFSAS